MLAWWIGPRFRRNPRSGAPKAVLEDPQVKAAIEAALKKIHEGGLEPGKDAEAVSRLIPR
jgi:hypothetical protein